MAKSRKILVGLRLPPEYSPGPILSILNDIANTVNRHEDGYVHSTVSESSDYSASTNDSVIVVDTTSGDVTVTLPSALNTQDKRYAVKKADASANRLLVTASAGNIDGGSTKTVTGSYTAAEFISDGTNYWTL